MSDDGRPNPPRPPNAWIIFRRAMLKVIPPVAPGEPRRSQGEFSRIINVMWRGLNEQSRAYYDRLAEEAKALHRLKYPDYKYRPKKKEEKERLRALEKEKKETAKQLKKTRQVSVSAMPDIPKPAPRLARAAPYYIPDLRYGPGGPSPPLSAASSPSPDPPEASGSASNSLGTTESSASPSPFNAFPSTLLNTPISPLPFPILSLPPVPSAEVATVEDRATEGAPVDDQASDEANNQTSTEWNYFDEQPNEGFSTHAGDDNANIGSSSWNNPSLNDTDVSLMAPQPHLFFNIPQPSMDQVDLWLRENGVNPVDTQLSAANHVEAYQLLDFDPLALSADFNGEIEINVGTLPPLNEAPSYLSPESYGTAQPLQSGDYLGSEQISYPAADYENMNFDFMAYLDGSYVDGSTSALQPVENSIPSSSSYDQPYAPPSGAANSGNRRVAATYRKEHLFAQDHPAQQEVHAL
ncbi:hypothetical protein BDZ97DRAFT_1751999 [Flammula alnicola]|nr:hypothetical protein BDZ97DRAFT_1751999 [Flammula alnicola]